MSDATTDPVFDLSTTYVHLSPGGQATVLPDFSWDPAAMAEYGRRFAAHGDGGRLVMTFAQPETWTTWERHPAGEEVVVLLSGRIDLIQEIDGEIRRVPMTAGQATVNPPASGTPLTSTSPASVCSSRPARVPSTSRGSRQGGRDQPTDRSPSIMAWSPTASPRWLAGCGESTIS